MIKGGTTTFWEEEEEEGRRLSEVASFPNTFLRCFGSFIICRRFVARKLLIFLF